MICFVLLCGSGTAWASEQIVTVGLYQNPPKIFTSESGEPSGIFIDFIEYVAEQEGWTLRYVPGTWAEGIDRLERGEIDLMPDVAHTSERETRYSFNTEPVLSSWFRVYARNSSDVKTILDLAGKRISVLEKSVQEDAFRELADSFGVEITIVRKPDYEAVFNVVTRGDADAAISNNFFGIMNAHRLGLEDTAVVFHPSVLHFAAPKSGRKHLLNAIDHHLRVVKKDVDSVYNRSLNRWTSEDIQFELPTWLEILAQLVGFILVASLVGSFVLKRQVTIRTQQLAKRNQDLQEAQQEQTLLHQALRESEREYRELVMHANSIIIRWSGDGRITFMNEFGQQFFGFESSEIIGRQVVGTIVPKSDSTGRDLTPVMKEIAADPQRFERNVNENILHDGERVWIDWTNKAVLDEGRVKEVLSVGSDITGRIEAEARIRKLNEDLQQHAKDLEQRVMERTAELVVEKERAESADRLKSAFLAAMSHELRTPLNSIIGFTGILLQQLAGPLNKEQKKQLNMVKGSSHHLLELINDVLDISKIEAGQLELMLESFDPISSIEKTVALVSPLARQKGLQLQTEIPERIEMITNDQRRLEQILLNLLNNAVKFTEVGHVRLYCGSSDDGIVFAVSDTGIGIRSDEIPHLFQPFRQLDAGLTRRYDGSGLGLSICKRLSEKMGGSIQVESQWGVGSTFTVRIPRCSEGK